MHRESKQFGVKATNSFKRSFNQSLLKLSFLYGTILVAILFISGLVTFDEFSSRIGRRFKDVPPTITIQLPNGDRIVNRPTGVSSQQFSVSTSGIQFFATQTSGQFPLRAVPERNRGQLPTAEDIRNDLIAALIFVNGILLLVASVASYWLARSTLRPIRDSYERQRRFLGDASHELRTPLSILQIELENEMHNADEKQKEQITSKLEEVRRMSKLVGDLLTISRLDEDKQTRPNQKKNIDTKKFGELVGSITDRLSTLAKSHNVTLTLHNKISEQSKLLIPLDEELFTHAITNLIQNAIFYNKKDGTVDVTIIDESKKISIEIKDSGIGISKEDLEKIFDRFYQADKSRTRKNTPNEGSGLGLSIAKSALLYMGGNLEIKSELNIGTTVQVKIKTV
ncbi:MAG: ATP-binding protein [Candidatus Pacebacteria bacterium]|nr:ATP-binding protein [Candidatus Paceibacterota bacterium]